MEEDSCLPYFFNFVAFSTITNEALREYIITRGCVL